MYSLNLSQSLTMSSLLSKLGSLSVNWALNLWALMIRTRVSPSFFAPLVRAQVYNFHTTKVKRVMCLLRWRAGLTFCFKFCLNKNRGRGLICSWHWISSRLTGGLFAFGPSELGSYFCLVFRAHVAAFDFMLLLSLWFFILSIWLTGVFRSEGFSALRCHLGCLSSNVLRLVSYWFVIRVRI